MCHNISYKVFTTTTPRCSDHQGTYCSSIHDVHTPADLGGILLIEYSAGSCTFVTNGIPNHDINDGSTAFSNTPAAVSREFTVTNAPAAAPAPTPLSVDRYSAILLNGAIVDLFADGCCDGGVDVLVGCDPKAPWRLDPMSPEAGYHIDTHNAHCQADGTYHYHGPPSGLYVYPSKTVSPVIGFAADGFPIRGPYFEDSTGVIREAVSSWQSISTARPAGDCPVGTTRDGKYIDDYQYVAGSGDLDQCNGMVVKGQYAYFVTSTYPYIMGCFTGTPDPSFSK